MKEKVLITGGTGLIGKEVIKLLEKENYEPMLLSRSTGKSSLKTFHWNVERNEIEYETVKQADHIIHLAGAAVGKRWTRKYKQEITDSRIKSIELLHEALLRTNHRLKSFVSASAIGYYGDKGNELLTEEDKPGNDFLADVSVKWEAAADTLIDCAERVVKLRTGIVLSKNGGALPQLMMPMKFRVSIIFGNGQQYYSWIHIHDMANMYVFALQHNINGVFNAVAPNPVTLNELIADIEKANHISTLKIHLPLWLLKLPIGEFAETLFASTKVSASKIEKEGFEFQFKAPLNLPGGKTSASS